MNKKLPSLPSMPSLHLGNTVSYTIAIILLIIGFVIGYQTHHLFGPPFVVALILSVLTIMVLKIADQWQRAVVLRLGRCQGVRGPGLFWI